MAEEYPIELRRRVVEAYEAREGAYPALAQRFRVGQVIVKRWVGQLRKEGHLQPRKKGGVTPSEVSLQELAALVSKLGNATADGLTAPHMQLVKNFLFTGALGELHRLPRPFLSLRPLRFRFEHRSAVAGYAGSQQENRTSP